MLPYAARIESDIPWFALRLIHIECCQDELGCLCAEFHIDGAHYILSRFWVRGRLDSPSCIEQDDEEKEEKAVVLGQEEQRNDDGDCALTNFF